MKYLYVFILRFVLSVVLAAVISRLFWGWLPLGRVLGFAAILLVLAYLFEYTREKDKSGQR
ncbi:MAG: hypothetical protein JRJ23_08210 [Deltaproteobacteria bacterium]|jgi:hypothetical protein|nr:hypothetical protein [Deltaproteobacteria bacterium]MBW1913443.1 hypothetical protein [Deltaproteobacteria bacterium]